LHYTWIDGAIQFRFCRRPTEESVETKKESNAEIDTATEKVPNFPVKYCPVTHPPEDTFHPPTPYRQEPYPGQFFYGDNDLWTAISLDQTWTSLPYTKGEGYGQKLFYQREGYYWLDEPEPALIVTGHKIDPESNEEQTLVASRATNGYTAEDGSFMLVGATFPSLGCWEITAHYLDTTLTYTIWVGP
jgi:hypothetical protein